MSTAVSLIVSLLLYGIFGFLVFFLGSRLSEPALSWKESLIVAAVMAVCGVINVFVPLVGVLLALIAALVLLIKCYKCTVLASLAMTVVTLFVPALILAYVGSKLGTPIA